MPSVTLHPIAEADAAELLSFELENRAFFEKSIAGFGDDYYNLKTVERTLAERVQAWETGESFHYLIRGAAGELVGRISLFGVRRGPAQSAEVGYRIAERHSGRGCATAAVGLVLKDAFEVYGLHRSRRRPRLKTSVRRLCCSKTALSSGAGHDAATS